MNKLVMYAVGLLVVIGLGVASVLYHDMYKQEQEKLRKSEREVAHLQELVEANEKNTPQELVKTSTEFIETMFQYDPNDPNSSEKALLGMTTGKAYSSLSEMDNEAQEEDMEEIGGFESKAVIKDSTYNRLGSTDGKVIVNFEHWLTKDGSTDKTVNEATVMITFKNGKWLVSDYTVNPIL